MSIIKRHARELPPIVSDLYQERYTIAGRSVVVRMNHRTKMFTIFAHGFKEEYTALEYEGFDGNMRDFARSKLGL